MEIRTTSHFDKKLAKSIKKNRELGKAIKKQVNILEKNLKHPSLKLHKLEGKRAQEYSFWIQGNIRITFMILNNSILFTDLITHDEY